MAENKTKKTSESVEKFLESIDDPVMKKDCKVVCNLMQEITKKKPAMWGDSIIGFDTYTYKYASGRSGEWFILGFSPRKRNLTLYIMPGYKNYSGVLKNLGPHKLGKCCLYIKNLSDIDLKVLKELLKKGYTDMKSSEEARDSPKE